MSPHSAPAQPKSEFAAAEEIKSILSDHDRSTQERILRWVGESLGLGEVSTPRASASASSPPVVAAPAMPMAGTQPKDIKSFVQMKQPKSDNQFVTVVAFFYRFVAPELDRKEAITTDDLQTAARQARGYPFKRPSLSLNNAVNQGYLDRAERGSYRVNAVGENLVAMTLPGSAGDGSGPKPRARRRKSGAGKARNKRRK